MDKYLGLPFLLGHKKRDFFDHIVENVMNKVNVWYSNYLSYAGRMVPIRSVSNTIPSYCMSVVKIPKTCIDKIDSIQRAFLCNGKKSGRVRGKVKWDLVHLNQAYVLKHIWKLLTHPNSLWS